MAKSKEAYITAKDKEDLLAALCQQ